MNLPALSTTQIAIIIAVAVVAVAGIVGLLILRNRRTKRLRTQFGGAEYDRALAKGGSRRHGEAGLEGRSVRIEALTSNPSPQATGRGFQSRGAASRGGSLTVPGVR